MKPGPLSLMSPSTHVVAIRQPQPGVGAGVACRRSLSISGVAPQRHNANKGILYTCPSHQYEHRIAYFIIASVTSYTCYRFTATCRHHRCRRHALQDVYIGYTCTSGGNYFIVPAANSSEVTNGKRIIIGSWTALSQRKYYLPADKHTLSQYHFLFHAWILLNTLSDWLLQTMLVC